LSGFTVYAGTYNDVSIGETLMNVDKRVSRRSVLQGAAATGAALAAGSLLPPMFSRFSSNEKRLYQSQGGISVKTNVHQYIANLQ